MHQPRVRTPKTQPAVRNTLGAMLAKQEQFNAAPASEAFFVSINPETGRFEVFINEQNGKLAFKDHWKIFPHINSKERETVLGKQTVFSGGIECLDRFIKLVSTGETQSDFNKLAATLSPQAETVSSSKTIRERLLLIALEEAVGSELSYSKDGVLHINEQGLLVYNPTEGDPIIGLDNLQKKALEKGVSIPRAILDGVAALENEKQKKFQVDNYPLNLLIKGNAALDIFKTNFNALPPNYDRKLMPAWIAAYANPDFNAVLQLRIQYQLLKGNTLPEGLDKANSLDDIKKIYTKAIEKGLEERAAIKDALAWENQQISKIHRLLRSTKWSENSEQTKANILELSSLIAAVDKTALNKEMPGGLGYHISAIQLAEATLRSHQTPPLAKQQLDELFQQMSLRPDHFAKPESSRQLFNSQSAHDILRDEHEEILLNTISRLCYSLQKASGDTPQAQQLLVAQIKSLIPQVRGESLSSFVSNQGHDVKTPLARVISAGNLELTQAMLERGANVNFIPDYLEHPLKVAAKAKYTDPTLRAAMTELLQKYGAKFAEPTPSAKDLHLIDDQEDQKEIKSAGVLARPAGTLVFTTMDGKPYNGTPHEQIKTLNKEAESKGGKPPTNPLKDYKAKEQQTGSGIAELWGPRETQEDRIVVAGFDELDKLLERYPPKEHELIIKGILEDTIAEIQKSLPADISEEGSTVAANIIYKNKVYNLSLGDSDTFVAIYDKDGNVSVKRLNEIHHHPDQADEKERIAKEGGFVTDKRIMGILAVSRAVGDNEYETIGLSHDPAWYTDTITIPEGGKAFIITACDGMTDQWKDKSKEEVEKLLTIELQRQHTTEPTEIAAGLASMALAQRSTDNISVVVTPVDPKGKARIASVFDGHGGDQVAEFIYQQLPDVLAKKVKDRLEKAPLATAPPVRHDEIKAPAPTVSDEKKEPAPTAPAPKIHEAPALAPKPAPTPDPKTLSPPTDVVHDRKDEKVAPFTTQPERLLNPDNIQKITAALNKDWKVSGIHKLDDAPVATVVDDKNKPRFNIYVDKITTNDVQLDTFVAMLKSYQAVHGDMKLPEITTNDKASQALWLQATKIAYKDKGHADDKLAGTVKLVESQPVKEIEDRKSPEGDSHRRHM